LGVALADESDGGAKVAAVEPKSAADKAGLQKDDLVLSVAGRKIVDAESLVNAIGRFKPGDVVRIKIKRGDETKELTATLGKRPRGGLSRSEIQNTMSGALSNRRGGFPIILQHDTVLRPRECGGPLVDLDGKVVGINIARAGRVESYAIPAEVVQGLLPALKSGKLAPPKDEEEVSAVEKARANFQKAKEVLEEAKKGKDAKKTATLQKAVDAAKSALDKALAEEKQAKEKK
jgi:serine protease Do